METFLWKSRIAASAEDVYAWHTRPGVLLRLTPPWSKVALLEASGAFEERRVRLALQLGPLRLPWVARHIHVVPGRSFTDIQESGPFSCWIHEHLFEPDGPDASWLVDRVHYRLPAGVLGRVLGRRLVRQRLRALFDYRHRVTADDLVSSASSLEREKQTATLGSRLDTATIHALCIRSEADVRIDREIPDSAFFPS